MAENESPSAYQDRSQLFFKPSYHSLIPSGSVAGKVFLGVLRVTHDTNANMDRRSHLDLSFSDYESIEWVKGPQKRHSVCSYYGLEIP